MQSSICSTFFFPFDIQFLSLSLSPSLFSTFRARITQQRSCKSNWYSAWTDMSLLWLPLSLLNKSSHWQLKINASGRAGNALSWTLIRPTFTCALSLFGEQKRWEDPSSRAKLKPNSVSRLMLSNATPSITFIYSGPLVWFESLSRSESCSGTCGATMSKISKAYWASKANGNLSLVVGAQEQQEEQVQSLTKVIAD